MFAYDFYHDTIDESTFYKVDSIYSELLNDLLADKSFIYRSKKKFEFKKKKFLSFLEDKEAIYLACSISYLNGSFLKRPRIDSTFSVEDISAIHKSALEIYSRITKAVDLRSIYLHSLPFRFSNWTNLFEIIKSLWSSGREGLLFRGKNGNSYLVRFGYSREETCKKEIQNFITISKKTNKNYITIYELRYPNKKEPRIFIHNSNIILPADDYVNFEEFNFFLDLLQNPLNTEGTYAHQMESCFFCGQFLENERSMHVGYGKWCAEKWNLLW